MVVKHAAFRAFNRATARCFAASAVPGDDNQPFQRFAAAPPRQRRRPVLLCRWRRASAGGLECSWHADAIGKSDLDEPGISRMRQRTRLGRRVSRGIRFVMSNHIAFCRLGCTM